MANEAKPKQNEDDDDDTLMVANADIDSLEQ